MIYNVIKKALTLACLVLPLIVCSQAQKEVKIGDVCPDIQMKSIVNYPVQSAAISEFKGQLLILDFWATWCQPCVVNLPRMDSLQKKFNGKVTILPVTYEDKEHVLAFLNRLKAIKKLNVTSVTDDKELGRAFRHTYLPHEVWIDKNGKVIAITSDKDVTEQNISAALGETSFTFVEKKDLEFDVINQTSRGIPIFPAVVKRKASSGAALSQLDSQLPVIHSTLTKYIEGLDGGAHNDSSLFSVVNMSIARIYSLALWRGGFETMNESKLIIDVPDSFLYRQLTTRAYGRNLVTPGLEYNEWLRANGYCYEVRVPSSLSASKFDIMLNDLNAYFGATLGVEGVMGKRKSQYLALVRTGKEDKLASKTQQFETNADQYSIRVRYGTIKGLVYTLRKPLQLKPYIEDETGYTGRIDIDINCDLSNIEDLNKELSRYSLKLVEKQKMADFAIVRMKRNDK